MINILSCNNSTSTVEEIKARLSIEDIFHICFPGNQLTRRNNKLWSKCVFHQEKTASLCLDPQKNRFYCFGCHAHGDQIDLYALAHRFSNREAIKQIAAELGLSRILTPEERAKLIKERARRKQEAKINEDIEKAVRQARDDCWSIEGWIYLFKKYIYDERDLDRPGPEFALKNLAYIEYLGDLFLYGTDIDKLRAMRLFRRWEVWQNASGLIR